MLVGPAGAVDSPQAAAPARSVASRVLPPLTLPQLWLALAVALPVLAALIANLPSVDLAYGLRAGGEIIDRRAIPVADTWTFTIPGTAWTDQQWLAQVLLAATFRVAGWTGLVIIRAALVGLAFGAVLATIRERNPGASPRLAALLVLAAFVVAAVTLALRPQLFGIAAFAVTLWLLARARSQPRAAWAVPLVVAAWANLHGSFPLGVALVLLAWLEARGEGAPRADRLLLVALGSALAACVNPLGPGAWAYAAGLTTNPGVTSRITEWQPTTLHDGQGLLFWASVAAVAVFLARRRAQTSWPALAGLGAFAALGAWAVRGLAWWPLAAAAIVGRLLPAAQRDRPARATRLNTMLLAVIAIAGIVLLPAWRPNDPGLDAPSGVVGNAPPGITAQLRTIGRPGDRLWNPQPWGSWFEFALPELQVATDARVELFPESIWQEYATVSDGGAGWSSILDGYGVTIVVATDPEDAGLLAALAADAGWRRAYADEDGTVWLRADRPVS
jgi:hypothetical protein